MVKEIHDFCNSLNLRVTDYSGRCMFGEKCIGIICNNPLNTLLQLVTYIIDNYDYTGEDIKENLGEPKWDDMGLEKILYFPFMELDKI